MHFTLGSYTASSGEANNLSAITIRRRPPKAGANQLMGEANNKEKNYMKKLIN